MKKLRKERKPYRFNEELKMSTAIEELSARMIFNCRGEETLEIDVVTGAGFGRVSAPSGASTGKAEVVPYPVGGVEEAIVKVREEIAPELIGMNAEEQETVDLLLHEIDGTEDFRNIGGSTACTVSLATAEAAATSLGIPLHKHIAGSLTTCIPYPLGNVLGGGKHALGKVPDVQEFLVLPFKARTFSEAAKANVKVHQKLCSLLKKKDPNFTGGKGDEGAWAANLGNEEALGIVAETCKEVSEELGLDCRLGLDIAASTLWEPKEKCYVYSKDKTKKDPGEQLEFMLHLIEDYNLFYIEDPFHEDHFEDFANLKKKVKNCLICGDDLFATNKDRLLQGVTKGSANAVVIKVNEVGTLTDAWKTAESARKAKYTLVMAHRSGETVSDYLAHLAIAFRCQIIKSGVVGGERVAKINELLRIENTLGRQAKMSVLSL
jgi:enolase